MDHGGTTIYAKSLIDKFAEDLVSNLYGNPHSACTPAKLSGQIVDETREKTLRFFGADPEHFDLVFVANATAAIKLVMESFKDLGNATKESEGEGGFWYGYHADSHTSVVGVRESTDGDHRCFRSDTEVEEWIAGSSSTRNQSPKLGLFAYPGQSNMTGRRLPLSWPGRLRKSQKSCHQDTYTLLDAAALATTYPLNGLFGDPDSAPDFTALSFYKIFGFPDLGGLIVRKASGKILQFGRKYFGGGTVSMVTVLGNKPWFKSREVLHESLEDGTLPFHNIIALSTAIDVHQQLYGPNPMETISRHTAFLGKQLYDCLTSLRHSTGVPVCQVYKGAESLYGDSTTQGATIAFNVLGADGKYIPYTSVVEKLADKREIFVRSGQLCNPGGIARHLEFETWHMTRLWSYGHRCGGAHNTGTEIVNGKPTGVVRVSLGAMTTIANVDTLIAFLRDEFMLGDYPSPVVDYQEQSYDLAVRGTMDKAHHIRIEKYGQPLSEENLTLAGRPPFAPTASWGSTTETRLGAPSSYRPGSSISSSRQYSDSVHSLGAPPLRAPPPTPRKPVNTDFETMGLDVEPLRATPRSVSGGNDDGSVQEEDERRGLKKLWKHRGRKSGSVSTLA